jgi:hypothetical protein
MLFSRGVGLLGLMKVDDCALDWAASEAPAGRVRQGRGEFDRCRNVVP